MMNTETRIGPGPETAHDVVAEEINRLKKEQQKMYGRADADRIEVDNQIELLRHVLRRIHNEVR